MSYRISHTYPQSGPQSDRRPAIAPARWTLCLALWLSAVAARSADGTCVAIPDGPQAPVTACELEDTYTIDIVGEKLTYTKDVFQQTLLETAADWLDRHGLASELLANAAVEIYLAVPEANPAATQARAQVRLRDGRAFVAYLSPRMQEWTLSDADIGILTAGQAYPKAFGHRAASLLVEQPADAHAEQFIDCLAAYGVRDAHPFAERWWAGAVDVFAEQATAARLAKGWPIACVSRAQENALVEWIARRERVFAFSWPAP